MEVPLLMTVLKEAFDAPLCALAGWMKAAKADITVMDEKTIALIRSALGSRISHEGGYDLPPPAKGGGEKVDARVMRDGARRL